MKKINLNGIVKCDEVKSGFFYKKEGEKYYKLMIGDEDVLEGKKAVRCGHYGYGYLYMDEDGDWYITTKNTDGKYMHEKQK